MGGQPRSKMAGPPFTETKTVYNAQDRTTLCMGTSTPDFTLHRGDDGFLEHVATYLDPHENEANEKLAVLKSKLPKLSTDEFWATLMEGIADILGAQYTVCSKRVLPTNKQRLVEMPALGEPGACLSAIALFNADNSITRMQRDLEYETYGGPCANMKHDKTFIVPTGLMDSITHPWKDKSFPKPMESYIGVPLWADGKCFGHVGAIWSVEGAKEMKLSWGFMEMILRALEDVVAQRVLEGESFVKKVDTSTSSPSILSRDVVKAMQNLKPYARSLSHELRTPMHGVVGMLDIMYATVQDALEAPEDQDVVSLLRGLRENIETIQDSSKRAVEAADNVVHAYDLNMEVPDIPAPPKDEDMESLRGDISPRTFARDVPPVAGQKRRNSDDTDNEGGRSPKHRVVEMGLDRAMTPHSASLRSVVHESNNISTLMRPNGPARSDRGSSPASPSTPGMRITRVREVVKLVVNESLRTGGRPDSAIASATPTGEIIEVRNRSSNGEAYTKMVDWSVEPSVPEEILVDERDFTKLISVLFLNALKFTSEGNVRLLVTLSPKNRYVLVTVSDTGAGIPEAFRPYLFKAFSREDDSLTRQNEGLGLGLLVAKGVARRIGGDLTCVRSDTEGPQRGSEFELRVPLTPLLDNTSRHSSPSRAPTPLQLDSPSTPPIDGSQASPRMSVPKLEPIVVDKPTVTSVPATLYTSPPVRRDSHRASLSRLPPLPNVATSTTTQTITSITTTPPTPKFDRHLAKRIPLNVLVAEDNKINRRLLVAMLKRLGYTSVQEAYDGTEAVRLMELDLMKPMGGQKVDLILMDLMMPNMDGYEATKRILGKLNGEKKPKILAISADVTDEALDRARGVGMNGFMTKPYRMLDLERLLVEYCAPV